MNPDLFIFFFKMSSPYIDLGSKYGTGCRLPLIFYGGSIGFANQFAVDQRYKFIGA